MFLCPSHGKFTFTLIRQTLCLFGNVLHIEKLRGVSNIWKIYGKYMGNLWEIYGKNMENIWKIYGKYMGNIWELYGKYMGSSGQ